MRRLDASAVGSAFTFALAARAGDQVTPCGASCGACKAHGHARLLRPIFPQAPPHIVGAVLLGDHDGAHDMKTQEIRDYEYNAGISNAWWNRTDRC